jgi:glycine/D-amino acid oxidase-like deaminating enzyme
MGMDDLSYWADTVEAEKSYRDSPVPESVDCAVIGGGLTGISAAYHLAQEGLKVALLERERLGWGASSRNGGMASPGVPSTAEKVTKQHGLEVARRMFDASLEATELVKRLIAQERIDCDLQETGSFAAAYRRSHFKALQEHQRILEVDFDHPTQLVPPERTREELGTDRYYGGLVDESAFGLHPARFVAGLARCADEAGVSLHEGTLAVEIRPTAGGYEIAMPRQILRAREVVVATNGYTGDLSPWLRRRVFPLGSYIIVTEPMVDELADRIIPHRRMIYDTKNLLYYFRILPDNRMMFGGRVSFTPTSSESSGKSLRKGMLALFPELADVRVEYSWGGMLGMAFDRIPRMGQMEGMHYAAGYSGRGLAMATYLGMKLAELIAGKSESPVFSETRFRTMILYRKRPWFLPLVGAYYRFKDWIA